jgi:thiamine-monophosphate kinase
VLTHDMMVEGVHWLPTQDMADVAWKLVATNLSDLAAKGAVPAGVLLGYMLGRDDARFLAGLREALDAFDVPCWEATPWPRRACNRTTRDRADRHRPCHASSRPCPRFARPGDGLWLTGPLARPCLASSAAGRRHPDRHRSASAVPRRAWPKARRSHRSSAP